MYFAENLKFIREKCGWSQAEAAGKLGIPRTTLGDYERGHTEPSLEALIAMARNYGVSIESLLCRRLRTIAWEEERPGWPRVVAVTVDAQNRPNIELVRTRAAAGYIDSFADPEFISELPHFQLPALQGRLRAFEIEGDSMLPLESGSIVVCRYVEKITDVKDGHCYVAVSMRDGVVYKRLQQDPKRNGFVCRSDNANYPTFALPWNEVRELWEYQAHIAFRDPATIHQNLLEEKIEEIRKNVADLLRQYGESPSKHSH